MENSERVQSLFAGARDVPLSERAAYLDAGCNGDASLRAEVESLLRSHDEAGPIPSQPTREVAGASAVTTTAPMREGPGTRIGPYTLLQLIGEGGFGSVFMAEQEEPVRRRVALKIIKLGMDTRQVIARFEAERQALAMMDHPNIARVLDAGATETGRPFFVMELVKGDPIVEYCDKNNLRIQDRLELFAQVCNAVQHAHTKGIIHRDIKPSNILVSTQDGRPHTKVIDFGIAKATANRLTEKTLFTEHRALIGTPEYMSPEQAEGSMDIDTRTDVYSLGVLLYELLTGTTPFGSKELRSAAYGEIQRIIREVEPPKPSTRISQSTGTIASVAAHRHTEPRKLGVIVRGELDWIVMKALEKDRQRRYETASALGMDVQRHLAGEAILAAPPSALYTIRKFITRHKGSVAAAGAVAAALVLGFAGTIWQARAAATQRDLARSEAAHAVAAETESHRRADDLQRVADFQGQMLAQVDPATAGVRLSEDVRTRFDAVLSKAALPDDERSAQLGSFVGQWSRVNATDTALALIDQTILRPAAAAIDKQFMDQPVVAASLRHVLAERYHGLGLDAPALVLEQRALAERRRVLGDEHPDTLLSIGNTGVYLAALGKMTEAEPYYRDALEKSRRVRGDDHPDTLECISNMGSLLIDQGKLDEAEPFYREALERRRRVLGDDHADTLSSINDWGNLLREEGKLTEAEPFYREALAKRRRTLGEEDRDTLISANNLAVLLKSEGKLDESIQYFREVTEKKRRVLGEMHPSTLTSIQSLGAVLDAAGHSSEAEALLREALAKQRQLLGADHNSTLATLGNLSTLLIGQKKFTEAEPLCRETLERRQRRLLGPNHPGDADRHQRHGLGSDTPGEARRG